MKRIATFGKFLSKIRPILGDEINSLSIKPCTAIGSFDFYRAEELINFCKSNPQYHVVSIISGRIYFNDFSPWASEFFLARGDNDPFLAYIPKITLRTYKKLLISKFSRHHGLKAKVK